MIETQNDAVLGAFTILQEIAMSQVLSAIQWTVADTNPHVAAYEQDAL